MVYCYKRYLRARDMAAFSCYIILPIAAVVLQSMFYGLSVTYTASTLALLIIFINIQSEQESFVNKMEKELLEERVSIMLSQIQPHFLYNSLTAISRLCDVDSRKAKKAVVDFSNYLRGEPGFPAPASCGAAPG